MCYGCFVCTTGGLVPTESRRCVKCPGTVVKDNCGCRTLNLGPPRRSTSVLYCRVKMFGKWYLIVKLSWKGQTHSQVCSQGAAVAVRSFCVVESWLLSVGLHQLRHWVLCITCIFWASQMYEFVSRPPSWMWPFCADLAWTLLYRSSELVTTSSLSVVCQSIWEMVHLYSG